MIEVPPDISAIFYAIVESRGGESCFDEAQLELTLALARMTADVRSADPGALVKLMDVIQKSADSFLPPRKPQPRQSRQPPITRKTTLHRANEIYNAALAHEDLDFLPGEDEVATDARLNIDGEVALQPPPAAPPPPADAAASPAPQPAQRSDPEAATPQPARPRAAAEPPVESSAPAARPQPSRYSGSRPALAFFSGSITPTPRLNRWGGR
jgi:hypothetical protein